MRRSTLKAAMVEILTHFSVAVAVAAEIRLPIFR
jgi:hypothetical protein